MTPDEGERLRLLEVEMTRTVGRINGLNDKFENLKETLGEVRSDIKILNDLVKKIDLRMENAGTKLGMLIAVVTIAVNLIGQWMLKK